MPPKQTCLMHGQDVPDFSDYGSKFRLKATARLLPSGLSYEDKSARPVLIISIGRIHRSE